MIIKPNSSKIIKEWNIKPIEMLIEEFNKKLETLYLSNKIILYNLKCKICENDLIYNDFILDKSNDSSTNNQSLYLCTNCNIKYYIAHNSTVSYNTNSIMRTYD